MKLGWVSLGCYPKVVKSYHKRWLSKKAKWPADNRDGHQNFEILCFPKLPTICFYAETIFYRLMWNQWIFLLKVIEKLKVKNDCLVPNNTTCYNILCNLPIDVKTYTKHKHKYLWENFCNKSFLKLINDIKQMWIIMYYCLKKPMFKMFTQHQTTKWTTTSTIHKIWYYNDGYVKMRAIYIRNKMKIL